MEKVELRIIKTEAKMEKKTEREKMMDRNGIEKKQNRKKERELRKGRSKNKRMHNPVRIERIS